VSLRTRIAAVAGMAVAVTVLAAAVVVYVSVRSDLRDEVDSSLVQRARGVLGAGRGGPGPGPPRFGRPPPGERFGGAGGYVQLVTEAGEILRPGESIDLALSPRARAIASGGGEAFEDAEVDGVHLRVLTVGLGRGGAVQVARPLTEVDSVLRNVLTLLVFVGLAGIGLAALLGAAVARTALAPVARFTRRTEALAGRMDLSERMEEGRDDELGRLARSFNATLDALEESVEAQRHLVADASHELRTPIASLRANIQTLEHADRLPPHELASLRADVVSELDELTALVGDVVELARGTRRGGAEDDVRLDDLVRSLVERAERRGDKRLRWHATLEPVLVRGDRERMARAVSNLLDNARKWSPAGGAVDVRVGADGVVSVRDRGPGFAAEDLPQVFDRFYRAAEARGMPGSGLGLAIVRQTAEAHGGWARAANADGGGAELRVFFGPPYAAVESSRA
jgi:two-component system, OmpR family, sensor histidine kinase MprB